MFELEISILVAHRKKEDQRREEELEKSEDFLLLSYVQALEEED